MAPSTKESQRAELHKMIWRIANDLRGSVDGWDFKQYVLGFLFYRFISENLAAYLDGQEHEAGNVEFDYARLSDSQAQAEWADIVAEKGYFIFPRELFVNVRARAATDENLNETLQRVFTNIEGSAVGTESEGDLKGLFDDLDVNSSKLGPTVAKRNEKLVKLLDAIGDLPLGSFSDNTIDLFGDAYEYLMQMYASQAGKSGGEYYTPQEVSELLARITVLGKTEVNKVYDPAAGSGSLLLKFAKVLGKENVRQGFYGQEINLTTYNLARINMKIGLIYSYGANDAADDGILEDEAFDTDALSGDARAFLEDAIQDYNDLFGTSYDTSTGKFQNYYKDLSQRLKNRELDLVIVVNMFLTGFDATTLNTLFVDKNLRSHGLIQAYSRTNRILNSVKTYGNIVSFRDLEDATNDAIALFGNKDAGGVVLLKPYVHYYADYAEKVDELLEAFPLGAPIIGEAAQKEFIGLFGAILRLTNILTSFDDFAGHELLTARQHQDYRSVYLDLFAEFRKDRDGDKEPINEDVVFEIELIKQVEINVDYILMLVQRYRDERADGDDKEIRAEITRAVNASPSLRDKRDLIQDFVDSLSADGSVDEEWLAFVSARRDAELEAIITREGLRPKPTQAFVHAAFRDGAVQATGTAITKVLPPVSRFAGGGAHADKKARVISALRAHVERFLGLGSSGA